MRLLAVSGGLDSTIAWFYLGQPQTFYIRFHHRYMRKELRAIKRLSEKLTYFKPIVGDLNLNAFEWEPTDPRHAAYIPLRNLYIALYGYNLACLLNKNQNVRHNHHTIFIIGVKGDKSPDKSPEAYALMTNLINGLIHDYEPRVKIDSPFWNMTKGQIVKWFMKYYERYKDFAIDVLKRTLSCYRQEGERCGACPACFRTWVALTYAGIDCDDWFDNPVLEWDGVREYYKRAKNGYYDEQRCREILIALKRGGWNG